MHKNTNASDLLKLGLGLHKQGEYKDAEEIYKKILRRENKNFDALQLMGVLSAQTKKYQVAVNYLTKALEINTNHAACFSNRGNALKELGRLDEALSDYRSAVYINPGYAEAYCNMGVTLYMQGKLEEAVVYYERAIDIRHDYAEAYSNLGNALKDLGRLEEAANSLARAMQIKPDYAKAFSNFGNVLRELKLFDEAIASYERAIALDPSYAEAYSNLGVTLQASKRLNEALTSYERAIALDPHFVEAYSNLGNLLKENNQLEEALEIYGRAIEIEPDSPVAYSNRGVALQELGRFEEAVANFDRAIEIKSDYAESFSNRGNALKALQRIKDSVKSFDRAIEIRPKYAAACLNKSFVLLLGGEYSEGWSLHEWRWQQENLKLEADSFSKPLWLGIEDIRNKNILLHAEQGLGDAIQFCRYAKLVKDLGAKVLLEVPKHLVALLRQLDYVDVLVERGESRPAFDFHCPLMSLPMVFGTELTSIPMSSPYLRADEVRVQYWKAKLVGKNRLKVGVVWNGGFRSDEPERWATNERRNIPLNVFAKGLNFSGADFFSLQKGDPAESEIRDRELQYWPEGNFYNYASELNDFTDTAALIEGLDIVLSVDTSTAHLAAAMGKPTWILNRYDTCWRWLLDRDDSPWYDAVKLYRQSSDMLWEPVLARVVQDFKKIRSEDN
jgi:tetratricopeptide (TPR) repeat protein